MTQSNTSGQLTVDPESWVGRKVRVKLPQYQMLVPAQIEGVGTQGVLFHVARLAGKTFVSWSQLVIVFEEPDGGS